MYRTVKWLDYDIGVSIWMTARDLCENLMSWKLHFFYPWKLRCVKQYGKDPEHTINVFVL